MRYALVADDLTEEEAERYEFLSYEDLLNEVSARISSGRTKGLLVRRHCCSSVHKSSLDEAGAALIRELAGAGPDAGERMRIAIDNWYMAGKPSLSTARNKQQTAGYEACLRDSSG
ncbi:MAG: hypothetical protein LBS92_02955 [Candidatus Methanoplasma sp.]|jgi:hypothetical protein|nr:hypothetical protein [Candidatus Methanoplasma sp.]